jgi:hypothetical protein
MSRVPLPFLPVALPAALLLSLLLLSACDKSAPGAPAAAAAAKAGASAKDTPLRRRQRGCCHCQPQRLRAAAARAG